MILDYGARLGVYEILAPIGAGGMGGVYKARDTRLDRTVAIKVSREKFSERFEREARAVAALNHPNICQLYDVGPNYLVMEFVEGSPVRPVENPRGSCLTLPRKSPMDWRQRTRPGSYTGI
jgi:serine/threonine protein kinase